MESLVLGNLIKVLTTIRRRDLTAKLQGKRGLIDGEREEMLQVLKAYYRPVQRLRTQHRLMIRVIKSLEQGFNGDVGRCFWCNEIGDIAYALQIHHTDYVESHNELEKLLLAHQMCNTKHTSIHRWEEKKKQDPRPATPGYDYQSVTGMFSSNEGAKHEDMRFRFNKFIHEQFNGGKPGWTIRKSTLAEKAVYECSPEPGQPYGSSKTYTVFINEDITGGIFYAEKKGGVTFVTYLGPRKDPLQ